MSKFLKGNYSLGKDEGEPPLEDQKGQDAVDQFERRALERLGGSIAFVMKRNTFVWNGDQSGAGEKERKG
jgi:hypothetical protein